MTPNRLASLGLVRPSRNKQSSLSAKFDYVVDFTSRSEPLNVHESRELLAATDEKHINAVLDRGSRSKSLPSRPGEFHPEPLTGFRHANFTDSAALFRPPLVWVHPSLGSVKRYDGLATLRQTIAEFLSPSLIRTAAQR